MIDPVTAIAGATKAFTLVKAMVEVGKSAEDTMMQVGVWYGHASDILYADKKAKNISPFKRVVFRKSVQQEAIQAFAAKKKLESQQRELISMINMVYGAQGLQEFRDIRKQIAQEREDTVYRQQEMKEQMLASLAVFIGLGAISSLIIFIVSG
jgi:ABC-type microcin C transport system permease subunit YejB